MLEDDKGRGLHSPSTCNIDSGGPLSVLTVREMDGWIFLSRVVGRQGKTFCCWLCGGEKEGGSLIVVMCDEDREMGIYLLLTIGETDGAVTDAFEEERDRGFSLSISLSLFLAMVKIMYWLLMLMVVSET